MTIKYGTVWVASAGNSDPGVTVDELDRYPAKFKEYIEPIIVVGASQKDGSRWPRSKGGISTDILAPGAGLPWPTGIDLFALPSTLANSWQDLLGTSFDENIFCCQNRMKTRHEVC